MKTIITGLLIITSISSFASTKDDLCKTLTENYLPQVSEMSVYETEISEGVFGEANGERIARVGRLVETSKAIACSSQSHLTSSDSYTIQFTIAELMMLANDQNEIFELRNLYHRLANEAGH